MIVDLGQVAGYLLSAGGAGVVVTLLQALRDARRGVAASRRENIADLTEWRDDLDRKLREAARDRDYWRDLTAQRGAQLREAGIAPADPHPIQPSDRERDTP